MYKKSKNIICLFLTVLILMISVIPVCASDGLKVEFTTDISYSGDNWWDRGVQYGRILVLKHSLNEENGTLLATHCELNAGLVDHAPGYPIYKSSDNGKTWEFITRVSDTLTGANSEWNPFLFELEKPCGNYPAGTIILAACSIDPEHNKASYIRLYFSTDGGENFSQGVVVASAGGLEEGVWEPFLLQLDDGRLVCYYSDDSDKNHSQKIVYKISSDGENWSESTDIVATDIFAERPGMPVVTRLGDGSYFMVYEVVDKDGIDGNPVYFRRSTDGLDWGDPKDIGTELINHNGRKALGSAPYCAWTSVGGEKGTLVVSGTFMRKGESKTGTDLFISNDYGESWVTVPHIIPYTADDHVGYSNSFAFSEDGKYMYSINNPLNPETDGKSKMVFALTDFEESMASIDIETMKQNHTPLIIGIVSGAMVVITVLTVIFIKKKKH